MTKFFQHVFPHERSDLSHWRKRLGDKLEILLAERWEALWFSRALYRQLSSFRRSLNEALILVRS
ncbi:hypothetical protein [Bradyrhizobium sp. 153]|uniref:hypothetical protein n=1 Tax=Bradyrhizobium sp. 153 TaxID=2782627 RepID=UPI001FFB1434|nr:hypothetical protein [Bradyrhizobium sp. 153]MCK1668918.1 hypothetical protein [Bradyrhizobium sp. 153]